MTKFFRAIEALRLAGEVDRQNEVVARNNQDTAGARELRMGQLNILDAIALLQEYDEGMTEDRGQRTAEERRTSK